MYGTKLLQSSSYCWISCWYHTGPFFSPCMCVWVNTHSSRCCTAAWFWLITDAFCVAYSAVWECMCLPVCCIYLFFSSVKWHIPAVVTVFHVSLFKYVLTMWRPKFYYCDNQGLCASVPLWCSRPRETGRASAAYNRWVTMNCLYGQLVSPITQSVVCKQLIFHKCLKNVGL